MLTLGAGMAALTLGAIFYMYGRNLPTYETLSNYTPKTISRIYSGEGHVIDEFAEERRLFTPAEEIPDLVKQAFISAEDKNFYVHDGYDMRAIAAAFYEARGKPWREPARGVHNYPAGREKLLAGWLTHGGAEDSGDYTGSADGSGFRQRRRT